jgi:hypothetical protein
MSRRGGVVAATVAAVLAVALPAWAYYALTSNTASRPVTAGSLGTPVTGTPSATATSVTFTVAAPSSGVTPTGYRVDRTAPSAVASVCTFGTSAGGTCTDSAPVAGQTNAYSVYALIGAWQSITPATPSVFVPPAVVKSYTLVPSTTTPTAGTAFSVTITAKSGAATDTAYTGGKTVNWTGGQTIGTFPPVYPASPITFTNGVATVNVTLFTAGAQTLTATDANTTAYTGSTPSLTVAAATPALSFSACTNNAVTVQKNTTLNTTVTRTGNDPYGNSTGTAAVATVTLSPSGSGNAKFASPGTVSFANGALATGSATYTTANGVATNTITAAATGYTSASCTVTTTN